MDTSKVISILKVILERMRNVQCIDKSQFDICLNGCLSDIEHYKLESLVEELFDEHTSLTGVINDVYDLINALDKFDVLTK